MLKYWISENFDTLKELKEKLESANVICAP